MTSMLFFLKKTRRYLNRGFTSFDLTASLTFSLMVRSEKATYLSVSAISCRLVFMVYSEFDESQIVSKA